MPQADDYGLVEHSDNEDQIVNHLEKFLLEDKTPITTQTENTEGAPTEAQTVEANKDENINDLLDDLIADS